MHLVSKRAGGAASMKVALAALLLVGSAGVAAADCTSDIAALVKKIQAENPGIGAMPGDPAAASGLAAPAGATPAIPAAPPSGPDPLAAADASGADAAVGNPPLAGPVAAMNKLSEANALDEAGDEQGCMEYYRQAEALAAKK